MAYDAIAQGGIGGLNHQSKSMTLIKEHKNMRRQSHKVCALVL